MTHAAALAAHAGHAAHAAHAGHAVPRPALAVVVALVLLGGYAAAAGALAARTGRPWRRGRTAAFAAGAVAVGLGLSPLVADLAGSPARAHMVQHVLVGMVAPLGLVLGAPLTLALAAAPVPVRRRGTALLRGRPVRTLGHPLTAGLLHVGGLVALYLTPLYAMTVASPAVHALVLAHVLLTGCLFTWSLVGPETAGRRPGTAWRAGVLVGASAAHGYLAKVPFLRAPDLPPGAGHDVADLQAAARGMSVAGDVVEVVLAVALFAAWYRRTGRRPPPHRDAAVGGRDAGRAPAPAPAGDRP